MEMFVQAFVLAVALNWVLVSGTLYDEHPGASRLSDMIIARVRAEQKNREDSPLSDLVGLSPNRNTTGTFDALYADYLDRKAYEQMPQPEEYIESTAMPRWVADPDCIERCYLCLSAGEITDDETNDCVLRCVLESPEQISCPSHPE
ncbi:hypothetical protein EB796_020338 [Bugula neritina]|uniref:Uncharacterized protein n=1 Tax=Bugula neritina TaxID=10212 RepID=A0A7J7J745_BUGNE|nr:hypothetical protein EB796_020338 [Bugula neritina]